MRILLIAPTFFGYRRRVSEELIAMGHYVDAVNDRPSESNAFKSIAKLSYRLADRQIDRYACKLSSLLSSEHYDRVIYMGGMSFCFTREQFEQIKSKSKARFTAYLWDSFINCQRFAKCLDLFDDILSFEPADCEDYGLHFRPLFFAREYEQIPLEPFDGFKYDACFIGSVHQPSKFEAVSNICTDLQNMGMRVFRYFYMPSKSVEVLRRLTRPVYRTSTFTNKSISSDKVAEVYLSSKAVIDSPQFGQMGLTMRTLEVLGSRRKLVTVNSDIKFYDFFDSQNIFVSINGSIPPQSFFDSPFREIDEEVVEKYSIRGFCDSLLHPELNRSYYKKGNV